MTRRFSPARSWTDRRLALVLVLAFTALVANRLRAPAPLPAEAPTDAFSGIRAREVLRTIAGDGRPRPMGSAAASDARDRIFERLAAVGLQPQVQEGFACGVILSCGRVRNVWALRPGRSGADGKLVMVSAHYDSVGAGPGASDDGTGVATVLEIARALSAQPPGKNPVLFLVNEGEETALLGAEAFVADHPLAKRVGAVVNVEARGTTGPSLMFETSSGNGPLIDAYARVIRRPATNSIYYSVYKMLPNDTDLTVYRRAGMAGMNFAFIDGEHRYHTPRDDFAHSDPATLQHQGENALAMVRELADADLDAVRGEEAVFFDVFNSFTVRWPARKTAMLAGAALAMMAAAIVLGARRKLVSVGQVVWGIAAAVFALLATAAVGIASYSLLQAAGAVPYLFLAQPLPAKVAFWSGSLAATIAAAAIFVRRAGPFGLWLAKLFIWAGLAMAAALTEPGFSYAFLIPSLVAGPLGILWALGPKRDSLARWMWIPPFAAAAMVWLPIAWLLYDGLGGVGLVLESVVFGLALAPLAGVWGRLTESRSTFLAALLGCAAGLGVQLAVPRFNADAPRKVNLQYVLVAGPSPSAQWAATPFGGDLPDQMRAAGRFSAEPKDVYPWTSARGSFVAPAPGLPLAPPSFEVRKAVVEGGNLHLEGTLSSPRGALDAALLLPSDRLLSATMNGKSPYVEPTKNTVPRELATGRWTSIHCATTGTQGVQLELVLRGSEPVDAYLWDATAGLPEPGRALVASRPANAAPYQMGDITSVVSPVKLQAR